MAPVAAAADFGGQSDLGGGEERVVSARHEDGARMAAFAFDGEAQTGRRGDGGDDAEWNALALQQRALLDVQFDECRVSAGREANGF